jgi:hypothetical protein
MLLLVRKSTQMRGVLNALETMAAAGRVSKPVATLLGLDPVATTHSPSTAGMAARDWVPSQLSRHQKAALHAARTSRISVINGPPGTGKSHTIAAITVDAISRGETVLIGARSDQAVDVVHRKITDTLGVRGVTLRGGSGTYLKELRQTLASLLAGAVSSGGDNADSERALRRSLAQLDRRIRQWEGKETKRWASERILARRLQQPATGWWSRWMRRRAEWHVAAEAPAWELTDGTWRFLEERHGVATRLVMAAQQARVHDLLVHDRSVFTTLDKALRTRTGTRKLSLLEDLPWDKFLRAFPAWLVNLADLHRVLPLREGLFDLAIIDEATQSDIASALPLLHRAKRVVIVGDPRQLRHVSFLSGSRQKAHADACGLDADLRQRLDFRNRSLLDLALESLASGNEVSFLDEHFRSRPRIIGFSNRRFYANRLRIMTSPRPDAWEKAVHTHLTDGTRDEQGINRGEAAAVLDHVRRIAREVRTSGEPVPSLGILSPFRAQVDHLQQLVEKAASANTIPASFVTRSRLLIGTAHSFQGEERDIMLLSMAIDKESPSASLRFLERPDVFNVSVTRARRENHIYLSLPPAGLPGDSLLRAYLEEEDIPATEGTPVARSRQAGTAAEIASELSRSGLPARTSHEVAGMIIDVLFHRRGEPVGIDIIGPDDEPDGADSLWPERHLILRRAGVEIIPVPLTHWMRKRDAVMRRLLAGADAEKR